MMFICDPSTWEVYVGGSRVEGHPQLLANSMLTHETPLKMLRALSLICTYVYMFARMYVFLSCV